MKSFLLFIPNRLYQFFHWLNKYEPDPVDFGQKVKETIRFSFFILFSAAILVPALILAVSTGQ